MPHFLQQRDREPLVQPVVLCQQEVKAWVLIRLIVDGVLEILGCWIRWENGV